MYSVLREYVPNGMIVPFIYILIFMLESCFYRIFLLYRKFLKQPEIVYNGQEIKNDMTKERRGLRHDVVYEVFCFGLSWLHYLTMEKELL